MMPSETNISWHLADQLRAVRNSMIAQDNYEHRYEERGDNYTVRSWRDGKETTHTGLKSERPEWLLNAVHIGKVGGYMKMPPEPPPNVILWFVTDDNHRLIEFIDFAKG